MKTKTMAAKMEWKKEVMESIREGILLVCCFYLDGDFV